MIVLLGTIFSLVLSGFVGKKQNLSSLGIDDIPSYIQSLNLNEDATLYMYGDKCGRGVLRVRGGLDMKLPLFGFTDEFKTLKRDKNSEIKEMKFEDIFISKKTEHVCMRIEFERGVFLDKFIVASQSRQYLFSPLLQEVQSFESMQEVKERYKSEELYPKNRDEYYR